ncbi:SNF2-related protein [uncultured Muribaculum sp.]|uniref:SNF2-related protein n=1 Tax=uncultured Muribaculum sp. TaxID=1918613 RepID=UPI0025B1FB4B|nr:SNF2-related protein [uncultured Muribaculum sp.]
MKLRDYQDRISDEAVVKLRKHGCCYLAMECRTGKTLTALVAASKYEATSILFLTKLNAIPSVKADYDALSPAYTIDITNYESAHKCAGDYDFIILDEAHSLGAYPKPSKRALNVKQICKGLPVLYLSGTPTPESYSQLFHQFWVCSASPFGEYVNFYKWARGGYVDIRQKTINGYSINDYSRADKVKIDKTAGHLIIPYSQSDAGFNANTHEMEIRCCMSHKTADLIRTLKKRRVIEMSDSNIIFADTPVKLINKLHQLSGGTVITESGQHLIIDDGKARYIRERFKSQKIAIFYVYKSEFDLLRETFPNWTDSPEQFQASTNKVFISQVRRAREGVRLDTADAIIFYSLEYSYLSYEQGKNRIMSKERKTPARICFAISDCGIDGDILEAVKGKKDFTASYYVHKHGKL